MSTPGSTLQRNPPEPPSPILRVQEIGMSVLDLDASVQLCTEVLGGSLAPETGRGPEGSRWRVCRFGDVNLCLLEAAAASEASGAARRGDRLTYVGLGVSSLAAAAARLERHGVRVAEECGGADGAPRHAFTDPASLMGVTLKLIEGEQELSFEPRPGAAVPPEARMDRLLHVGINVVDLEAGRERLAGALGARASATFRRPVYGLRFAMVRLGGIELELLSPDSDEGTLASSIAKVGEGVAHLCWSVLDLDAALDWMRRHGRRLIDETPLSILNLRAAFVHPAAFNGVLYELVEGEHRFFEPGTPETF